MPNRIKKGYLQTSFGDIHYRAAGEFRNPHLLLLHQTASSSAMYEAIMRLLSGRFYLFAPDTLGFGESDLPQERASIYLYAAATHEAIQQIGLKTPFVFGHHTGASIAVQMEYARPFARKMILSGPPYLTPEQKAAFQETVQPIVIKADGSHLLKLWKRLRAKDENAALSLTHREFLLNLKAGERYHEAYSAVFSHEFESQLAALRCEVLVMAGKNDTLAESVEPAFRSLASGAIKRFEGNTYICDNGSELVAEIIESYFV